MDKLVSQLRRVGYSLKMNDEGQLSYEYTGNRPPEREEVVPLLKQLRRNSTEVAEYLTDQITQLRDYLDRQGWAVIESGVLDGEHVVIASDETAQLPDELSSHVRYTLGEVEILLADGMPSRKELQQLHRVKREFEGTFVDERTSAFDSTEG